MCTHLCLKVWRNCSLSHAFKLDVVYVSNALKRIRNSSFHSYYYHDDGIPQNCFQMLHKSREVYVGFVEDGKAHTLL